METVQPSNKKRPSAPKNTAVYVSDLPKDVTIDELVLHFSKCGIIMDEIMTGKPRIKLYTDEEGNPKGDAIIVYLREESVKLALNILDESEIRPGIKIRVQEASFNENNSNEASGTKKNRVDKETWKKHMRRMQKKLEWFDEEAEAQARESARQARFSKILVLKNMYRPEELHSDPLNFPIQLSEEIVEECEEKLGVNDCSVQIVEDQAELGMCTVKFKRALEAQAAAKLMNGRLFAGLRVSATIYDGSFPLPKKKNVPVVEGDEEEARLEAFSKFIEGSEGEDADDNESANDSAEDSADDNDSANSDTNDSDTNDSDSNDSNTNDSHVE